MSVQLFRGSDGSLIVSAETAAKFEVGQEYTIRFPTPGNKNGVTTFTLKRES